MKLKRLLPLLFAAFLMPFAIKAQVTTSSIVGTVKSDDGTALAGATIKATHLPSGTQYATTSQSDGQFTIPNMRVGGPYRVEVTYVGYKAKTFNDLELSLGAPQSINAVLVSEAKSLTEVTVALNQNAVMSSQHEGVATHITQQQLQSLPTISRSIADFTRLTPQAVSYNNGSDGSSMGTSFGGANNRYNQFSIDGANATDVFGLASSGTNGGQAGTNPIPLDAIEQVQVVLSPYDVRQGGFTGGGINAVTRSGTNQFHGSAYTYYQNQSMVGKSVTTGNRLDKFTDKTLGFRIGGPIIKNKLFFFVNAETYKRSQPLGFNPAEKGSGSQFSMGALDSISSFLKSTYGYDPGSYTNFNRDRKSDEIFARIDWNISEKSKLTLRHSYNKSNDYNISRSAKSITFSNSGYNFQDITNSSVLELNTNISSHSSNMLRITYNNIRDERQTAMFPSVSIKASGGLTYNIGSEQYSSANRLDQDNFTLTDNYSIYAGKHTITIGTDNQFYNTTNIFLRAFNGSYNYSSIDAFINGEVPSEYLVSYSNVKDPNAPGKIHFAQFGVYGQDQYEVSDNFHLTYGLRIDLPVYFNKPSANSDFNSSQIAIANNVATNKIPKSTPLLSPRVGFNYDVAGRHKTQLRGGVGLFSGRVPFVWISNQYSNTGVESIKIDDKSPTSAEVFNYDPKAPHLGAYIPSNPANAPSEIDVTSHNFKVPRTLRLNLAIDQKLPWNLIGTIEGIYTKTIQDIAYQDINTAAPTQTVKIGNSTRPLYSSTFIDSRFDRVIMLKNTNKGYAYNITAQLQRPFAKGFTASLAYTLGHSYSLNDGTSSQAVSNWRYVYTVNGLNNPELTRSNYDPGSRVIAYVTKVFKYGPLYTSVGLVYTGQQGQPYSYAYYNGYKIDLNGDDPGNSNDIMYVPASQAEAQLLYPDSWADLEKFINGDKFLSKHKGQVLERNDARSPWENHFDLKLAEGWNIYKTNKLEFTVDVFNIGNLLNKKWGRSYYVSYQETEPIDVTKSSQWTSPTEPTFTFNPKYAVDANTGKAWSISDFTSRWNMKLGLRYSF